MSNFYNVIYEMENYNLLRPVPYKALTFYNTEKVNAFLLDIVKNNRSVFIYGDYDPDGLFCALSAHDSLKLLGCTKVRIYKYKKRTHMLDDLAVTECIQAMPDYCIICDIGSSELDKLEILVSYGIKVIILDHHNTIYKYSDFENVGSGNTNSFSQAEILDGSIDRYESRYHSPVAIINTTIENQLEGKKVYELSAGALTFCVFDTFAKSIEKDISSLSAYALVSLYADSMNMGNPINRSIYFLAHTFSQEELPSKIQMFMHANSSFYSRFIQFRLIPKINAIFRTEKFEYINECFFDDEIRAADKVRYLEAIDSIYTSNRNMVLAVADTIEYEEMDNFILANLESVSEYFKIKENKLYNYTGLIANKLSDRCGKPAVVYCPMRNYYKGSFRDISGRNYLQIFKQLCSAGGHGAAFGIKIPYLEFNSFLHNFKRLDSDFPIAELQNKPIIFDYGYVNADTKLIRDMALYNEFAGQDIPLVYLKKVFSANMTGGKTKFYYLYNWDGCTIQSSFALSVGDTILLQPIRNKTLRAIAIKM